MIKKSQMKIIFLFLTYIGLLHNCFSQSRGYVLPNDSTYIRGYITLEYSNPMRVIYKSSITGNPVYYTAQDLEEFGFLKSNSNRIIDRKFISVDFEIDGQNQTEFAQLLNFGNYRLNKIDMKNNI